MIWKQKTTYFKNIPIYMGGDLLNRAIPFLLIPLLTRYLTAEEYGILALASSFVQIVFIAISLNVRSFVAVTFFKKTYEEFTSYISSYMVIALCITSAIILLSLLFFTFLADKLPLSKYWIMALIFAALGQSFLACYLAVLRVHERALNFVLMEILFTFINFGLSVALVVIYSMGLEGRLTGIFVSSLGVGLLSVLFIYRRNLLSTKPNLKSIRYILSYCVPLLPHVGSKWVRNNIDRLIIVSFLGPAPLAIYVLAQQLSSGLSFVIIAFNKAYQPVLFRKFSETEEENKIQKTSLYKDMIIYIIPTLLVAILYGIIFKLVIPYYVGSNFLLANEYIIHLSIAAGLNGAYVLVANHIFYNEKTKQLSLISIISALIHLLVSYILVKHYDLYGAATAAIISFASMLVMAIFLSNRRSSENAAK